MTTIAPTAMAAPIGDAEEELVPTPARTVGDEASGATVPVGTELGGAVCDAGGDDCCGVETGEVPGGGSLCIGGDWVDAGWVDGG
jgi:hypothetical protein